MKYLTLLLLVCWWQGIAMAENYHGKVMSIDKLYPRLQFNSSMTMFSLVVESQHLMALFLYLLQREQLRFLCLMWEWKPLSRTTV